MKWVVVFLFVMITLSGSAHTKSRIPVQSNQAITANQDITYHGNLTGFVPMRYARFDPNVQQLVASHVFPMAALTSAGNFQDLGVAWIVETIKYGDRLLGVYSIFDRGKIDIIKYAGERYTFRHIYWNAIANHLFFIGTTDTQTILIDITKQGSSTQFELNEVGTDHQIYFNSETLLPEIFMLANGTNPTKYTFNGINGFDGESTNDIQISSFLGFGGIFQLENQSLEVRGDQGFSRIIPSQFTNHSILGHIQLAPTVYDPTIDKAWIADINQIVDLPQNTTNVFPLGFGSSLVRTGNNTIYEYDGTNWQKLAQYIPKYVPQSFAIVDVELYIGTIFDNGLELLLAGADGDHDHMPDEMESYYGSSSNTNDTDGDTIPDNLEIAFWTDPTHDDRLNDQDGDGLTNIQEFNSVLNGVQLDPNSKDTDFGGAWDGWELKYDYNPWNSTDDKLDVDHDGVTNDIESHYNSNPRSKDTDGDGMPDNWEIEYLLDPTNPRDANFDYDHDGRTNLQEYHDGTDPLTPDPPPLYNQVSLVFLTFCFFMLPLVNQIWHKKLGGL